MNNAINEQKSKELIRDAIYKNYTDSSSLFPYDEELEKLLIAIENANKKPLNYEFLQLESEKFREFLRRSEEAKFLFAKRLLYIQDMYPIPIPEIEEILKPLIPKCEYDIKKDIFRMKINFVPYLQFNTIKGFGLIKTMIIRLITAAVNEMKVKPSYDKDAVLIIFSLKSPQEFDVDNIDFKYIIDALRYSGIFYDDTSKYISYLVQGNENEKEPFIDVKIVRKSTVKIPE